MAQRPISAVTRSAGLLWRRQALARERGQGVERARALEEFAQLVGETLQGHPHFERRRGDPEVQKLLRQLEQAREALAEMSATDGGGAGDGDEEGSGAEGKAEAGSEQVGVKRAGAPSRLRKDLRTDAMGISGKNSRSEPPDSPESPSIMAQYRSMTKKAHAEPVEEQPTQATLGESTSVEKPQVAAMEALFEAEATARAQAEAKLQEERASRAEAQAQLQTELESQIRVEREARERLEAEKQRIKAELEALAESEAKARREAEARVEMEAAARARADTRAAEEVEARVQADTRAAEEAEARVQADGRAAAEAETRLRATAEAEAYAAEAKAQAQAAAEAKAQAQAAAEARAESEARAEAEAVARSKAEAEARSKREAQVHAKAEAEKARTEAEKARTEAEARVIQARKEAEARYEALLKEKDKCSWALIGAVERAEHSERIRAEAVESLKKEQAAKAAAEKLTREATESRAQAEAKASEEVDARTKAEARAERESEARSTAEEKMAEEAEARARALNRLLELEAGALAAQGALLEAESRASSLAKAAEEAQICAAKEAQAAAEAKAEVQRLTQKCQIGTDEGAPTSHPVERLGTPSECDIGGNAPRVLAAAAGQQVEASGQSRRRLVGRQKVGRSLVASGVVALSPGPNVHSLENPAGGVEAGRSTLPKVDIVLDAKPKPVVAPAGELLEPVHNDAVSDKYASTSSRGQQAAEGDVCGATALPVHTVATEASTPVSDECVDRTCTSPLSADRALRGDSTEEIVPETPTEEPQASSLSSDVPSPLPTIQLSHSLEETWASSPSTVCSTQVFERSTVMQDGETRTQKTNSHIDGSPAAPSQKVTPTLPQAAEDSEVKHRIHDNDRLFRIIVEMNRKMNAMGEELSELRARNEARDGAHAMEVDALVAQLLPVSQQVESLSHKFEAMEARLSRAEEQAHKASAGVGPPRDDAEAGQKKKKPVQTVRLKSVLTPRVDSLENNLNTLQKQTDALSSQHVKATGRTGQWQRQAARGIGALESRVAGTARAVEDTQALAFALAERLAAVEANVEESKGVHFSRAGDARCSRRGEEETPAADMKTSRYSFSVVTLRPKRSLRRRRPRALARRPPRLHRRKRRSLRRWKPRKLPLRRKKGPRLGGGQKRRRNSPWTTSCQPWSTARGSPNSCGSLKQQLRCPQLRSAG